jgi:hypothetical protein
MMKQDIVPSKKDLKVTYIVIKLVLTSPKYFIISLLLAPVFVFMLILPNDYNLILDVVIFGNISITDKILIFYKILPLTGTYNYSILTDLLIYFVSVAMSINITLLFYHFKEHNLNMSDSAGGTIATLIAVLGSGCASCGSTLIFGLFSLFGFSGLLTQLPLEGAEFLILAFLVTTLSTLWICKGLRGGMVRGCPII